MKAARATKPRTRFVLRPYRRIPTWYGSYMSGSVIGKGVKKLEPHGVTSAGRSFAGAGNRSVHSPYDRGRGCSIEIACASVRWANQYEFGLRIEHVTAHAANRLAGLITADLGLPPNPAH